MSSEQTIKDMARLAIFEGKLNDLQLKNLQMFPLVFFNGVSEGKLDYDLGFEKPTVEYEKDPKNMEITYKFTKPKVNHFVTYYLIVDESVDNSPLDKRFSAIEKAVRDLFWKGIKVTVHFNDIMKFESKDGK